MALQSSSANAKVDQPSDTGAPLNDFSGGLNVVDTPALVKQNQFIAGINMTLDETGAAILRLGLSRLNDSAFAGAAKSLYYSVALDRFFFQVADTLYKTSDWTSFATVATFTSDDRAGMVDFVGDLVVAHPVDGIYTYDGSSWTLATSAVTGGVIAIWQNKVWVTGNDSTYWWSNAGDATTWTTDTDFNAARDHDDKPLTAFLVGVGQDYQGQGALIGYKEDSFIRITDPQTGAYTALDIFAGAAGPQAVVAVESGHVMFCRNGIYFTDTVTPGATQLLSKNVTPMFRDTQMGYGALAGVCGERYLDRVVFSFPWGPDQDTNNRTFEMFPDPNPDNVWIVVHDFGASAFATYTKGADRLYSTSPDAGYARDTFVGGSDEGDPIAGSFQTRWFIPEAGYECQFQRLRILGYGDIALHVKIDFATGVGEFFDVDLTAPGAFVWNDADYLWNTSTFIWGPLGYQQHGDFWDLGVGKAISFVFSASSDQTSFAPPLNDDGQSEERGAWAVYSLLLDYVRLGLS